MIICLVFIFLVSSILLLIYNYKSNKIHKKLIESFKDELYMDLNEEDKQLYFSIIDTYELLLDRDPSEDELNFEFNEIKTKKHNLIDLHNNIKESMEYKRLNDIQQNTAYASTTSNNDIQDYNLIVHTLKELMPASETEDDPIYIEFLVMKYRGMNKDKNKLVTYLKKTPEYKDYKKSVKKQQPKKDNNNIEESSVNLIEKNTNVEHKISRPDLNKSTIKTVKTKSKEYIDMLKNKLDNDDSMKEQTCDFYNQYKALNEETMLSSLQAKRNLDKMKYHCELSKSYSNVNSDLKLLPGQEWSVPQKRTPVCASKNCDINDSLSQTALIGTLLNEVEFNSKILPSFSYEEKN